MNFGQALEHLKTAGRVRRAGWNGKGMWLLLVNPQGVDADRPWYFVAAVNFPDAHAVLPAPWIGMKTADNKFVPWLASQTDILAEDWEVVS